MKIVTLTVAAAACGFVLSGCSGEGVDELSNMDTASKAQKWVENDFDQRVEKFEHQKTASFDGNKQNLTGLPLCSSPPNIWSFVDQVQVDPNVPSFYEHLYYVQCQQDGNLYAAYMYDFNFNAPTDLPMSSQQKTGDFTVYAFAAPEGSARAYVISPSRSSRPNPGVTDGACNLPVTDTTHVFEYGNDCTPVGGIRLEAVPTL